VPVSCFLLFFVFQKITQEIFSELDETKAEPPIFTKASRRTKDEMEEGSEPGSPPGGAAQALAASPYGEASWPHL
jgi:hypothetical protein